MRRHLKRYLPDHAAISDNRWLRPFRASLLHPRLWHLNRRSAAGAVAAGLFCGLIPGPFQMLGAALCALLFRVNLPLSMLVTLYTNPLTIVPLYLVAYQLGRWLTGESNGFIAPPEMVGFDPVGWAGALLAWLYAVGKPLLVGLPVLAALLAGLGYVAVQAAWRLYLRLTWKKRAARRSAVNRQNGGKTPSR